MYKNNVAWHISLTIVTSISKPFTAQVHINIYILFDSSLFSRQMLNFWIA